MIERNGKYYISDVRFYFDKESLKEKPNKTEISIDDALSDSRYKSEYVLLESLIILCSRYNANSWLKLIDNNKQVFTIGNELLENKNYDVLYNELFVKDFEASTILKENEKTFNIAFEFESKAINYEENCDLHIFVPANNKNRVIFASNKFDTKCLNILAKCFNSILNKFQKNKNQNVLETILVNQKMSEFLNDNGKNLRDYDFSKPLYVIFEEQVKKTPDIDACIYLESGLHEKKITYKELDEKSSILAYKLQQAGVTKEVPVCVCMNRSINTFISILGIYKAGGIYVPLDLSYPEKYLQSILDEVKPKVLISDENVNFNSSIKTIDVSAVDDSLENKYKPLDTIENTAIIMYTSGSTGKPKGVKHRQFQVINRLNYMWEYYPFEEGDTLAQRTSVNYMPSMWEFFGALLRGKTTIIFSDNVVKDPDLFLKSLHKFKVSYLTVVPSLFRMMTSNMDKFKRYAEGVRVWTSCGEPLTMDILKLFRESFPNSVLINDYGSTETNGMLYFDSNFKDSGENILPHFKVVPNVNFYIFDNYMNQTPIGMEGNIYIGGFVKSTGYVNNELLNKEKFVKNPIKGSKDKILFKVGDRGVYHANGKIEVLGRVDHQVKIRGIRIDIDGIENVLEQNSKIERAVVTPKQQASGNKYLAAYIIGKNNDLTESDLRLYLEENIPKYMMPTQFIFANSLPLLPNGKVDRKKLTKLKADEEYVMKNEKADEKQVINKIVQIASEVLVIKTSDVFIDKKFYELGFDSVSIVELLKQINTNFNLDLSLADLYDNSSIRDFYKNCLKDKSIVINEEEKEDGNLTINNKKQEEQSENSKYLENTVKSMISNITMLAEEDINAEDFWQEIGMNLEEQNILIEHIQGKLRKKVTLLDIKMCNNIRELCALLEEIEELEVIKETVENSEEKVKEALSVKNEYKNKIAVIGMSCNYAGSPDKYKFWNNLIKEVNCISEIPKDRWNYKLEGDAAAYKWGGFVNNIEDFDYKYFHISEHEASLMDPQQKICLEQVYSAIEDSGYAIDDLSGKEVGVFIGARQGDYTNNLKSNNLNSGAYAFMGSDMAINSARISYLLNTKGPCMTIDTACSSSITAIHEAINSLKLDECEMTIAGGVSIMNTEHLHVNSANMGMLSKEGQCKTFDNKADGFVPGEGAGIVILKKYEKAVADGDRIYGIILGSSINQDGRTNGITAPSKESQYALEKKIYTKENINPETITYVEAHGTGTKLGDPIEIEALTKSFREWTDKKQYCAIGSVKTNIGHTVAASGVAAMIKVLLCLTNKVIPKSLYFNECNEYIDMKNSPFYVADKTVKWETNEIPRRAALSSFGFGGSNCHMVLEESTIKKEKRELDSYFIPLSAASRESLECKITNFKAWLKDNDRVHLGDISYTLTSIEKNKYRTALIVKSKEELLNLLERELYIIVKKQPSDEKITEELMDFDLEEVKDRYLHNADLDVRKYFVSKGYEIVSLPSYPFNREKCYVKYLEQEEAKELTVETIAEKYDMSKHILNNKKVLPGAAFIDYMCSLSKKKYDTLRNISFLKAVSEDNFKDKIIINKVEKGNDLSIEIHTKSLQGEEVNALGEVSYTGCYSYEDSDINSIKNRCSSYMGKEQCYDLFNSMKLNYRDDYSLIDEVYYNEKETLSRLSVNNSKEYDLNPHIIDAAFQTVLPLLRMDEEQRNIYIPMAVDKIEIYGDINNVKYVYAKTSGNKGNYDIQKYNIMILDRYGKVLASIFNFTRKKTGSSNKEGKMTLFKPVEVTKECAVSNLKDDKYVLVINTDYNEWNYGKLKDLYGNKIVNISYREVFRKVNKQEYTLCYENEEDFKKLFSSLSSDDIEFSKIINLVAYNHSLSNINKSLNRSIYLMTNLMKAYPALKDKNKITVYTFFDSLKADTEYYEALTGFAECERLEQNLINLKLCDLQGYAFNSNDFNGYINKEIQCEEKEVKVIYKNGSRKVIQYKIDENLENNRLSIKNNGVYVITGALGGLGRALTKYLRTKYAAKLILLGRRESSFVNTESIEYIKADVCDMSAVSRVITYVKNKYGKINGIFHCAGVNKDSLLKNKTMDSINLVIKPKVYGLTSLIRSVQNENVDFIACFSSLAAVIGNRGQSDYAYANAFMDACSKKYKNVVSIDWGLWKSGNMGGNEFIVNKMKVEYDITPIEDNEGFDMMMDIIASGSKNVSVLKGNNLNKLFKQEAVKVKAAAKVSNNTELTENVQDDLLKIALQVFDDEINSKTCFDDEELDSISLMEFAKIITSNLSTKVSVSSLFEFNTIEKLAQHLVGDNREVLNGKYGLKEEVEIIEEAYEEETEEVSYNTLETEEENRDVAIVGISGRFPGADNVEMFWQNLIDGKNSVIETPEERWSLKQFNEDIKDYVKYGGFLKDIDLFDSLYFNISPEEAKLMDPQQRILLEETVTCFENAGINQADLKGKNIDVYVGAFSNDYGKLVDKSEYKYDPNAVAGNDNAMLANRLSYFFNLKGESEVIDSACSSALVCIYRAVESIRNKKCDGAIAAAVNIILDPKGSIRIGNLGFLSKDGITNSFDENADGYVRGEGVGVIYLKALDKAIKDKDKIFAVIKGGAVNHSGKGHYLMEPNALAEAEVIKSAYEDAKVSIGSVNYLECHGTGTIVGDSNEIYAYKKAFKDLEKDKNINIPNHFCAIGTVKPNIGHLECASGMASIIKLIMALQNRKIPKTLVFNEINSEYDLENSVFYINDKLSEWSSIINEEGIELPRRGEVHSYGFGGTNAHLILEEYIENKRDNAVYSFESQYNIFPFSAKTIESLKMYIEDFISFLEGCEDKDLNRISYTLQEIKTEYDERVAFVADSKESLIRLLKAYLNDEKSKYILCRQNENVLNIITTLFLEDSESKILMLLKDNNNLIGIASLWVNKIKINWKELFDRKLRKILLPAYKFTKQSYWIETKEENYVKEEPTVKTKSVVNEDFGFEEEVAKIIAESLGLTVEIIISCENLVDIGLNSIMLTKVKYKIESKLNIKLRMNQLAMKNNFKELLEYVKEQR